MHQELSKDGENHNLGDARGIPLNQSFSRFAHVYFCFSSNIRFSHKLRASVSYFLYVKFHFVHVAKRNWDWDVEVDLKEYI
jgi:hypothetical protein